MNTTVSSKVDCIGIGHEELLAIKKGECKSANFLYDEFRIALKKIEDLPVPKTEES